MAVVTITGGGPYNDILSNRQWFGFGHVSGSGTEVSYYDKIAYNPPIPYYYVKELTYIGENLTVDASGMPVGGTVTGIVSYKLVPSEYPPSNYSYEEYRISGLNFSFIDLYNRFLNAATRNIAELFLSGDDTINAAQAADGTLLRGYDGNDTFITSGRAVLIVGGRGRDVMDGTSPQGPASEMTAADYRYPDGYFTHGIIADLGSGTVIDPFDDVDTLIGIRSIFGTQYNDEMRAGSIGSRFDGFSGNDTLIGGAGNDTLIGNYDADVLRGGDGDDWLYYDLSDTVVESTLR